MYGYYIVGNSNGRVSFKDRTVIIFEWLVDRAEIVVFGYTSLFPVLNCIVCRQIYIKDAIYYSLLLKFYLS